MLLEPRVAAQDACLPNEDPFASASLWDGLELPPLDEGDDAASAEEPEQGEPHNAHVVAYRAHREREAHVARSMPAWMTSGPTSTALSAA